MIKFLKLLKSILNDLITYIKKKNHLVEWRINNKHNFTQLSLNVKNSNIIKVGKYSYGTINVESFENSNEKLIIGDFVSIAPDVLFILGGNHQINTFTTYPLKAYFTEKFSQDDAQSKGPVIVGDEVWIGQSSIIMSGVKLGKGCVIAAGSVITKDVPPFAIFGGNPAKFIKWRIDVDLIKKRENLSLNNLKISDIKKNINLFYQKTTIDTLDNIKNILNEK